jgi:para-nitrobenzyl esterase
VPVVFGANQNEGSLFALAPMMADGELTEDDVISDEQYRQLVLEIFGAELYPTIYAMYHPTKYAAGSSLNAPTRALSDLLGDWYFNCPTRRTVRSISQHLAGVDDTSQAFLYRFAWKPTRGATALLGSHHGAELPFVFRNLTDAMPMVAYQPADTALADAMANLWTSFARTGSPNTARLPTTSWPAYDLGSDQHLILDDQLAAGNHLEQEQCDFWDSLGVYDTP